MKSYLIIAILFLFAGLETSYAQHKILMTNGKLIDAESYKIGDMFVTYTKSGDKKNGSRAVDRYDVFSIIKSDSTEEILYQPVDTLDFTVDEARLFIQGEQMARTYYSGKGASISSALIGAGSSLLYFYAIPIPMLYGIVLGRFNPKKMNLPDNFDPAIANTEAFRLGYNKSARNIKVQKSLKWGYIGLGAGLAGLIIYGSTQ